MCGISGIYNLNTNDLVSKETLKKMCDAMIHRGPDEEGFYINGNIGLGMRRLKIIDLDSGRQPIFNEDKSIVVIFNGEVYNFRELRDILKKKGHIFYSNTDTEVIVHLYEEYGKSFVSYINGMFSIALFDNRRKSLLLYRDRLGKKPLHFLITDDGIVFASEIKSILKVLNERKYKKEINYRSLYYYFHFMVIPGPDTIFRGINKLLPGHYLCYERGKCSIEKYWEIKYEPDYSKNIDYWKKNIHELLYESVKLRLISDVPLGSFLSGGIDSSIIVGLMSDILNQHPKTFCIGFQEKRFDESVYAKEVAKKFNTDHYEIMVSSPSINIIDTLSKYFDEPFADYSAIPTFIITKAIREYVTVALSGDGGDELFMGYDNIYIKLKRRRKLKVLPMKLRDFISEIGNMLPYSFYGKRLLQSINNINNIYLVWVPNMNPIFSDDFLKENGSVGPREIIDKYDLDKSFEELIRANNINFKFWLVDDGLVKVDRMSMANSLEVRSPFLDHRLVELACKIPSELQLKNNMTKYILKDTYKDILPKNILKRKKQGFRPPVGEWIKGELKDITYQTIYSLKKRFKEIFNDQYIDQKLKEHLKGRRNNDTILWELIMFNKWYENFYIK